MDSRPSVHSEPVATPSSSPSPDERSCWRRPLPSLLLHCAPRAPWYHPREKAEFGGSAKSAGPTIRKVCVREPERIHLSPRQGCPVYFRRAPLGRGGIDEGSR